MGAASRRSPAARPLVVEVQYASRRPWVPAAAAITRWAGAAHAVAPRTGAAASLCVRVVGPAASRRLNREYRGKDRPTNVLSFPASAEDLEFPSPPNAGRSIAVRRGRIWWTRRNRCQRRER